MLIYMLKKKTLQMLLRLRILRWGDQPGLSRWAQCNHKDPLKEETGGSESRVGNEMMDGGLCLCIFLCVRGKRVVEEEEEEEG